MTIKIVLIELVFNVVISLCILSLLLCSGGTVTTGTVGILIRFSDNSYVTFNFYNWIAPKKKVPSSMRKMSVLASFDAYAQYHPDLCSLVIDSVWHPMILLANSEGPNQTAWMPKNSFSHGAAQQGKNFQLIFFCDHYI